MIEKIISGGQTGADEAGLHAAFELGIKTGGSAPKGWRITHPDGTDGSNPQLGSVFGLVEHTHRNYQKRTIQNVLDSDGTALFGYTDSPGAKLALRTCIEHRKPYIINPSSQKLADWVNNYTIKILNVAGNRQSDLNPDIYQNTYQVVYNALKLLLVSK